MAKFLMGLFAGLVVSARLAYVWTEPTEPQAFPRPQ